VAEGRDPRSTAVSDVMTTDVVTCMPQETVEMAMEQMATRQVRRIPIVDRDGSLVGILAQADVATRIASAQQTGQIVQAISESQAT
jgi:CBS domain-containing protein